MLTGSNYLLRYQLQLGYGSLSRLTFREPPIFVCHVAKDTIYPCSSKVTHNASSPLSLVRISFALRLESPPRQAHMCVSCHLGDRSYTQSSPEIAFQSLGLVRGCAPWGCICECSYALPETLLKFQLLGLGNRTGSHLLILKLIHWEGQIFVNFVVECKVLPEI